MDLFLTLVAGVIGGTISGVIVAVVLGYYHRLRMRYERSRLVRCLRPDNFKDYVDAEFHEVKNDTV